jgi:hypothetical protein
MIAWAALLGEILMACDFADVTLEKCGGDEISGFPNSYFQYVYKLL